MDIFSRVDDKEPNLQGTSGDGHSLAGVVDDIKEMQLR